MGLVAHIRKNRTLSLVYIANLFLSLHYFLIVYINSTFLDSFFTDKELSGLYIAGSLLGVILFLAAPFLLQRMSNYSLYLWLIALEFGALIGLTYSPSPLVIGGLFILHQASVMMLAYSLDVFLETLTKQETHTSELRGLFLTIANATLVISPAIVAFILGGSGYTRVYLLSAILLIPTFLIGFRSLSRVHEIPPHHVRIKEMWHDLLTKRNIRNVSIAHLVLQFFYAWMVIYTPLYLHEIIGFPWSELGIMFTIMLLPFVLLEIPIGHLADKKYGEKEFMILGFLIIATATFIIPLLTAPLFLAWTLVLFLTRVGASIAEITTEGYFFKQVGARDAHLISVFRITRPISFVLAPVVASLFLDAIGYPGLYMLLALITLSGVVWSAHIKDSK